MEGTGSYGAGLFQHLRAHGLRRRGRPSPTGAPDASGKSDPADAIAAARAVQAGTATGTPKTRDGSWSRSARSEWLEMEPSRHTPLRSIAAADHHYRSCTPT